MREDYDPPEMCWEWPGGVNNRGYGVTKRNGENYAHRASWVQVNGPIPEFLDVLHRCDNPPCFRPKHLFLGTVGDNVHDMIQKGRASKPPSHLQPLDVPALVSAYESGAPIRRLRKVFRTSQPRIRELLENAGIEIRRGADARAHLLSSTCGRGHEFTVENTYIHAKTGRRQCRKCQALAAKSRARRRVVA